MAQRIKSPLLLTVLIVVLLSVGVAGAAKLITGKDIANHSITGKDIKKGSVPLSALKRVPAGATGPRGATGQRGAKGDPGLVGTPGADGVSAITEVAPLNSAIAASITPGTALKFVGEPAEIVAFTGDRGVIESTVTVGTTTSTIDDKAKFALSICVDEGGGLFALEGGADFGVSPVLATNDRVAVTVSSGFYVEGEPGEASAAEVGACVLNETASPLDNNDRTSGYVLISAAG
jgi:hypothetical protein